MEDKFLNVVELVQEILLDDNDLQMYIDERLGTVAYDYQQDPDNPVFEKRYFDNQAKVLREIFAMLLARSI